MNTLIKDYPPNPSLREFVRKYQIIRWSFASDALPPPKLLQPRPEHSIAFYIRDKQSFTYLDSNKLTVYPQSILSGIHTVTINRDCGHDFLALKVILHPCALFRLTGIPATELTSSFVDAEVIWGKAVRPVFEQLANTNNVAEALAVVEEFMGWLVRRSCRNEHSVDRASQLMLTNPSVNSLDWLARQSTLSILNSCANLRNVPASARRCSTGLPASTGSIGSKTIDLIWTGSVLQWPTATMTTNT